MQASVSADAADASALLHAVSSLMTGTMPATCYKFDSKQIPVAEPIEHDEEPMDGFVSVHLVTSGEPGGVASAARSVTMPVNKNGIWKAREFSQLLQSVQPPAITTSAADDL